MTRSPIPDRVPRLRQRRRADGSWRVWWEPAPAVRALGFDVVELDAARATWSVREAQRLNAEVARRRRGETPRPASRGRTVDNLIDEYRRSTAFRRKSDATRRSYEKNLRLISRKWGARAVAEFTKPVLVTWYETLYESAGRYQARALTTMMSILFAYAERIGWRADNSNPCARLGAEVPRGRARTASWDELDALCGAALGLGLPSIDLAVRLAALNGARETMAIRARCGDFGRVTVPAGPDALRQETVWTWSVLRTKRDTFSVLQVHPDTVPALMRALTRPCAADEPLLVEERTGHGYSADLFRKRWAEVRRLAAERCPSLLDDPLQFRDLRRTFGHWSRAGGASKDDTADVLGNSAAADPRLAEVYMATQFATARRAVLAIRRPEPARKDRKA